MAGKARADRSGEPMRISVVISTRNRGGGILATLRALVSQDLAPWEVIVTDQSDADQAAATREAVCQAAQDAGWQAYCLDAEDAEAGCGVGPYRLVYLASRRRGLSTGRNTAARRASGEILLVTDDDVTPDAHWVAANAAEFAADPAIVVAGGRVLPLEKRARVDQPVAARRTGTEVTRSGTERREYDAPVLPWHLASGGNMALRADAFEACGGFDEVAGAGAAFRSCEDLDICYRVLVHRLGKVVFSPASLIYHDNPKDWAEQVRTERGYGFGAGAILCKYWRCGHRQAAALLATWIWHMAVRRTAAGLFKWRNWRVVRLGLEEFLAPLSGWLAASGWPLDRERWLFRPRDGGAGERGVE